MSLRHSAAAVVLALSAACSTKTVTVPAADTTAPIVLFTSPAVAETDVSLNAHVSVAFSETMDGGSVASSLLLAGPGGAVPGTVAVSFDARAVTFSPGAALDPGSLYTATISTAARDAAGNHLGAPATWSFRTGAAPDLTPPSVTAVSPAAGSLASAATTPSISATFSEPIDCAQLPFDAIELFEGNLPVPGYVACSGAVLEFVPVPALPTLTSLVAVLSPLVSDLSGNPLVAARVWEFDVRPWTRQFGSPGNDIARSVATDAAGNVLVAGYTDGDLGGHVSIGWSDLIVVKYDPSGANLWTRQLGTTESEEGLSVATDAAGNVYVAGRTFGALDGNPSAGNSDLFVVKYDPSGAKLWTRQLGSPSEDIGASVAIDAAGNVFVAGYTEGDLDGNVSAGGRDLFVVKYDPSGVKQWIRQLGTTDLDEGSSVATDGAGNIYVAGLTGGGLDGNVNVQPGNYDLFVVKFDPSGAKLWTRQLGTAANDFGQAVATDAAGNVFAAGMSPISFDGNTPAGGWDVFLVKYDSSGAKLWTRQLGSPGDEYGWSVATDAAGNAFVAGQTNGNLDGNAFAGGAGDLFVVKYGPDGAKQWTRQLGSTSNDLGRSVATDAAGNLFVAGVTNGGLDGNLSTGGTDLLVVKYGPDGRKR